MEGFVRDVENMVAKPTHCSDGTESHDVSSKLRSVGVGSLAHPKPTPTRPARPFDGRPAARRCVMPHLFWWSQLQPGVVFDGAQMARRAAAILRCLPPPLAPPRAGITCLQPDHAHAQLAHP